MSINKVLNRPLFRKEALRRGAIKPIKARVGRYFQGPNMYQGAPTSQGDFRMIPTVKQGPKPQMFNYNPQSGNYLTGYGSSRIKQGAGTLGKGLLGISALYGGAEAVGVPNPLLMAMGYGELAALPIGMMKGPAAQTTARMIGAGGRFASTNPIGAIGLGGMLTALGGTKEFIKENELVKDYAKANNISLDRARSIFRRDMVGKGGRPITDMKLSDVGKAILATTGARGLVSGELSKSTKPGEKSEADIAAEMRGYFSDVKRGTGRYLQDVDQLVANAKKTQQRPDPNQIISPDDEMNQPTSGVDMKEIVAVGTLRNKLMTENPELDIYKATNIATALTKGELQTDQISEVISNNDLYAKVPNQAGDPNHPTIEKVENTVKEVTGQKDNIDPKNKKRTGNQDIDTGKDLYNKGITLDSLDPRKNAMDPQRTFLLKLAAGLLSGKTTRGGAAGFGEILGAALGPAIDAATLVKMKNDEAYRDWASTVLDYNLELYKARNKDIDRNLMPGSFALPNGEFVEARRDKDTGQVFLSQDGALVPVTDQEGQFFEQKQDAELFDNVKLIADGYLSSRLLEDSIKLMESNKGKTAIGASGIFVNLIDLVKNMPGELKDGFFGASTDFNISNNIDPLNDKEFKKIKKRTDKAIAGLEDGIEDFLSNNPEASSVLAKLRVNARMLTYSLANSLKDKDRLTNRDLQLIEELTQTLTAGMTDEKIIAQYKELLKEVNRKNDIRIGKLGVSGYTKQDTDIILNSMGLGGYATPVTETPADINSLQDAYDALFGQMGVQ